VPVRLVDVRTRTIRSHETTVFACCRRRHDNDDSSRSVNTNRSHALSRKSQRWGQSTGAVLPRATYSASSSRFIGKTKTNCHAVRSIFNSGVPLNVRCVSQHGNVNALVVHRFSSRETVESALRFKSFSSRLYRVKANKRKSFKSPVSRSTLVVGAS